jgi:hypothetical protein
MTFSVGILYSVQEFLRFADTISLTAEQFAQDDRFVLSNPADILRVAQDCNWIRATIEGTLVVSDRGRAIVGIPEPAQKLRSQIEDLISTYQPPWSAKMRHGRAETLPAMPLDVQQCFRESGLMDPWSTDVVKWWDSAAQMSRLRWSERLSHTGRLAEQLTCEYENNRTQTQPQWICLDSNFEGYDVLSQLSEHNAGKLLIEVKGSERRPKEADFSFTRNEYRTAQKSNNYVVHLWFVGEPKLLYVVPFPEISKHLPTDSGDGNWEITRIPFSSFSSFRAEL